MRRWNFSMTGVGSSWGIMFEQYGGNDRNEKLEIRIAEPIMISGNRNAPCVRIVVA
jgi:hypothetical protein